jgi:hypothetical protein
MRRRFREIVRVGLVALGLTIMGEGSVGQRRGPEHDAQSIRPWASNPRYWEYKGRPTLLVGGSDDDNLFQWPEERLDSQLALLRRVGGNYVRNTMSDRRDGGFEQYAFGRRPDGKYDLDSWNDEYWSRFERFLQATNNHDIIVQIEVWDRFDYSGVNWPPHPYNPINNVNYTREASGLAPEYPEHPGANAQPFFFTTPRQRNVAPVLRHQQRFVDRLLAHTLKYGHVLYSIDNETSADAAWAQYWAEFIKAKAKAAGRRVHVTEMWDDWDTTAARHRQTLDHPDLYDFADLSQNNHNSGRQHWRNALWAHQYVAKRPRPLNAVKTYGADGNRFGHTDQDGLERFFRHIMAGFAAVRFHRPDSGLGLNPKAQSAIAAVRALETVVNLWDLIPGSEVLGNGKGGDVYTSIASADRQVLYFPSGGRTTLPLAPGRYDVVWIGLQGPRARENLVLSDGGGHAIVAPDEGHWFAVLHKRVGE